jgi:hypothetical protein
MKMGVNRGSMIQKTNLNKGCKMEKTPVLRLKAAKKMSKRIENLLAITYQFTAVLIRVMWERARLGHVQFSSEKVAVLLVSAKSIDYL